LFRFRQQFLANGFLHGSILSGLGDQPRPQNTPKTPAQSVFHTCARGEGSSVARLRRGISHAGQKVAACAAARARDQEAQRAAPKGEGKHGFNANVAVAERLRMRAMIAERVKLMKALRGRRAA
jgi:hypothetical protein